MSKKRRTPPRPAPARTRAAPKRSSGTPEWLLPIGLSVAGLVLIVGVVVLLVRFVSLPGSSGSGQTTGGSATGQTIDGIQCQTTEQVVYHIHAHLAIFANGQVRTVAMGIGIPNPQVVNTPSGPFVASGDCFYWLHTHATDGIIHVESPSQQTYTLGNFFDIWGQALSPTRVGSDQGTVIAYVNGQRWTGDPRQIPLTAHAVIQLNVGTDVAPRLYTFAPNL